MAFTITLWLERLLLGTPGTVSLPQAFDRKPMGIEVERQPDYLWRDLGFPQPRRPEGE